MSVDRIVVGAGLSGILAALEAAEHGDRVTLIDAAPRIGGALSAAVVDGFIVDTGAEAFSTARGDMADLLDQWGLGDEIVQPSGRPAHIAHADGLKAMGPGVLGIPAGPDRLRSSGLSQEEINEALALDSTPWFDSGSWSVAELVSSRLGTHVLERLVEPVVSAVFGAAAAELAWDAVCPDLVDASRGAGSLLKGAERLRSGSEAVGQSVASVRGGLHRIVEVAEQRLVSAGVTIQLGTAVSHVEQIRGGWVVGTSTERFVPQLTLAVGPSQLQHFLGACGWVDTGVPALRAAPSRTVVASVDSEALDDEPFGTGVLIAKDYGGEVKALTHMNAKWQWWRDVLPPHRHLVRLSMSDLTVPPEDVRASVAATLSSLAGVEPAGIRALVVNDWPDTLSTIGPGATETLADLVNSAKLRGLDIRGAGIPGNGLLRIATDHYSRQIQESAYVAVH